MISMALWDDELQRWSDVKNLLFNFYDETSGNLVLLGDLQVAVAGDQIAVVGVDAGGEVWFTQSALDLRELLFSPPPPWSYPGQVSSAVQGVSNPLVKLDREQQAYILWEQPFGANQSDAIFIAQRQTGSPDLVNASQANVLVQARAGELARQPDLLIDERDRFHLVWSGGLQGEIQYKWSSRDDVRSGSGWSTPVTISDIGLAASPQLGMDDSGQLYMAYLVPINEARGIYLTTSIDRGSTWSTPEMVFDAAAEGYTMIEQFSMAVSGSGLVHLAWVDPSLSGSGPARGINYIVSQDRGMTWSSPFAVVSSGYENPELVQGSGQIHLLFTRYGSQGIFQMWKPSGDAVQEDARWSVLNQVPGMKEASAAFAATADGRPEAGGEQAGRLHLVSLEAASGDILYTTWEGENWSSLESYSPYDHTVPVTQVGFDATTLPEGGVLAISWLAEPSVDEGMQVFSSWREISPVEVPAVPTPVPTATPEAVAAVEPTDTPTLPTPTPGLSAEPLPQSGGVQPSVIGIILASMLVVVIFVGVFLWRGRR
jgi:hypothetical protein